MSLQCNEDHISHLTDSVRTFIYRKGSLEGKQNVSTVHTSSWYGTNHYPNADGFLGAQNGTRFLSGKPTFGKFNFLASVFRTSMPCMGTGQTARSRDAPVPGEDRDLLAP